jgi:hypothetical protein
MKQVHYSGKKQQKKKKEPSFLKNNGLTIVLIFLRQNGSPQSKPVDVPDSETGN